VPEVALPEDVLPEDVVPVGVVPAAAAAPSVVVVLVCETEPVAVVALAGVPLTAWVNACRRLANRSMPWSLPSLEESPSPPPPPCRCGLLAVPKIAARLL
jgi:hypothetical protein